MAGTGAGPDDGAVLIFGESIIPHPWYQLAGARIAEKHYKLLTP
jgi:hypothetical protein